MRKLLTALTLVLATAACAGDTMGPDDRNAATLDELAVLAYGAMEVGQAGAGDRLIERLGQLPPELALTAGQLASIATLIQNFMTATDADRAALAAIHQEAVAARSAGQT